MKTFCNSKLLSLAALLFSPMLANASPMSCASVFSQNNLPTVLTELFKEDSVEFSKLKEQTTYPGIVDSIEASLNTKKITYLERISKTKGQPYIVIQTEGPSPINSIAKEVFQKWQIVVTLDPNFPAGALGSYEGMNGQKIKGLMITRTFDDRRFLSNMYHEFIHAYLTNLEFKGKAHPLSLYFFRNPELNYDGIQYGRYLPTQEFATFLRQGLVHSESAIKSLNNLFDLTGIVKEFQNLQVNPGMITKIHKGYEAVGIKTNLGDFYVPKAELEANNIAADKVPNYISGKMNRIIQISQTIRDVLKPSIDDLGGGIVILKSDLTEQQSQAILQEIQTTLFEKYPDLKSSLSEHMNWTNSFWLKIIPEVK